jgi:hypothetical protein
MVVFVTRRDGVSGNEHGEENKDENNGEHVGKWFLVLDVRVSWRRTLGFDFVDEAEFPRGAGQPGRMVGFVESDTVRKTPISVLLVHERTSRRDVPTGRA